MNKHQRTLVNKLINKLM